MSTVVGYLVGERGEISGLRVAIPKKGLIIGRDPNHADLVLDHTLVSRRHAQITPGKDGKLYLIDLQSRNGTHLNGRRITAPVALSAGDNIDFGGERKAVFVFESAESTSVSGVLKEAFGETVAPVEWKPSDVIGGRLEVHGTLGKGGFGTVYLVYDRDVREMRALKTIRREWLTDGERREAFKREALLWLSLDEHPSILSARWVDEYYGRLFVLMDYVAPDKQRRVTLSDHLAKTDGPLDVDQALEWAIQFCAGMEHAVTHGIKCHRDIKPANILVTRDGMLKITDFGLAVAAEAACRKGGGIAKSLVTGSENEGFSFSAIEVDGMTRCGTLGYMPPEVFRGEPADIRGDIYSFGLVLWQMGTGSRIPPFLPPHPRDVGTFPREVYERQMDESLPRLKRPLWPVVKRCLRAKPTKRYSDFRELRDDLAVIFRKRTGRTVTLPDVGQQGVTYWANKGACLNNLGLYEKGLPYHDKALEINPGIASIWHNKGVALYCLRRFDEALACYEKALSIDPQYANAWNNKGMLLEALGRNNEALGCFDKALAIEPLFALAWSEKGEVLRQLRRREEAVGCFDKALTIDPLYTVAWARKGSVLGDLSKNEEAVVCYDRVLAIDPRFGQALVSKGSILIELGRNEEAVSCLDKALAIDHRDVGAWTGKGCALDALDRIEEAIACFDKALEINPQYAPAWFNKGLLLGDLGHPDSIPCLNKAFGIGGHDKQQKRPS
ncbi:MAG: tetratricopeptide repeat protein [Verrucomicrobiia bacterium]